MGSSVGLPKPPCDREKQWKRRHVFKPCAIGAHGILLMTMSAEASSHYNNVTKTIEEMLAIRQTETAACEDALTKVRDFLEVARGQALECGCPATAENLVTIIEISKSAEYSRFNRSQGLGTLRGGLADIIQCSCYGC